MKKRTPRRYLTPELIEQYCILVEQGIPVREALQRLDLTLSRLDQLRMTGLAAPSSRWHTVAERLERLEKRASEIRVEQAEKLVRAMNDADLAEELFTPEACDRILAALRTGVHPHVAAEQSGVPQQILYLWLERGIEEMYTPYRAFYLEYISAVAQARADAESRIFENNPLAWLLHGQHRERGDGTGWSKQSEVKATTTSTTTVKIETKWGNTPSLPEPSAIDADVQEVSDTPVLPLFTEDNDDEEDDEDD